MKPVTIERLQMWLKSAQRGNRLVYHTGNLAYDRQNASREDHATVNAVANIAYQAAKAGQVTIAQRRVDDGVCAYVATMA